MNLDFLTRQRPLFICAFVVCVALMATALTMQYAMNLEPCPLCVIQRGFVIALAAVALLAALNLPADQVPECGPGLEYLLEAFPLTEALSLVFRGSGECAEVQWVFLGLTIPGWTLVIFGGFTIFGVLLVATRFGMPARDLPR